MSELKAFAPKVLFAKVSQILNLVRRIDAQANQAYPVVDFIVDSFDRAGTLGLGQYWENRGAFAVVPNKGAMPIAGAWGFYNRYTSVSNYVRTKWFVIIDDYYGSFGGLDQTGVLLSGGQLARYKARLSSDNLTITADFTITSATYWYTGGGHAYYSSPLMAFGIASSFDRDELGGVTLTTFGAHVQEGSSTFVGDLCALRSFVSSSNGANIATNTVDEAVHDYRYAFDTATNPALRLGNNQLKLRINGTTVDAYVNGTKWFSDSTGAFSSGRMVGLFSLSASALIAGAIGATPPAVTRFKAWVDGCPEPGTQSGHGISGEDGLEYIDGYHTDGSYNPAAFD